MVSRISRIVSKLGEKPTIGRANRYGLKQELNYIDTILDKLIEGTIKDLDKNFLASQKLIYSDILEMFRINANTPLKRFNEELEFPWSGLNYKQRLRKLGARFKVEIRKTITQGIRKGNTLEELLPKIDKVFDKHIKRIELIQKSESEHFINTASIAAYKKLGIKEVFWYARIDERTCEVCGDLHEQTFTVDKIPQIPQHPHCRCRIVPIPSHDVSNAAAKNNK